MDPKPPAEHQHGTSSEAVGSVFRREHGRVMATLVGYLGDIDLAEDAVAEAFQVAVERWPVEGLPANPGGWLTTTAKRRAIDRIRRESRRQDVHDQAAMLAATDALDPEQVVDQRLSQAVHDDELRLIFTCCHPALNQAAQVALTLRLLGGLATPEIARAFIVPEKTMAQRLVRAKRKIKDARIPYRVPQPADIPERLPAVLTVVYLIYTTGHTAPSGPLLTRDDLCAEAIRLARVLDELLPEEPEVRGLLALLLLTEARRAARTDDSGALVLLADQDRSRWDAALTREGHELVRQCLRRSRPGPFQLQAAISAVHNDAPTASATDWRQVLALYDQLLAVMPTTVVALNRAVALAEVDGAAAGLAEIDRLQLPGYQPWHLARATMRDRLGDATGAAEAYREALGLTGSSAERAFVTGRLLAVSTDGDPPTGDWPDPGDVVD